MKQLFFALYLVAVVAHSALASQIGGDSLSSLENRVSNLKPRLEALTAAQARMYFELGEEVAAEATDFAEKRLARELFVLAIDLDLRATTQPTGVLAGQPSIAASACLALAAMADVEDQRRWLSALAATLSADAGVDCVQFQSTRASKDPAAFELATLLGWVRAGDGRRAAKILEKPGVSDLLEKFDKMLNPTIGGGAERVRRMIEQYPICSQCRNRRFVKGPEGVSLCPSCKGLPGPNLSARETINQLRVESILLSGVQRSWAGQSVADSGSPLRDLDPSEVAAAFAVDPSKPLWREGRWVTDPNASKPVNPTADGTAAPQPSTSTPAPGEAPYAPAAGKRPSQP